jgi:hypothetical protein
MPPSLSVDQVIARIELLEGILETMLDYSTVGVAQVVVTAERLEALATCLILLRQQQARQQNEFRRRVEQCTRYWTTFEDGFHGLDPAPPGKGEWLKRSEVLSLFPSPPSGAEE